MSELGERFDKTKGVRVLVLGDIMLDRYTWGDAERVSPEAPVLVLRAEEEEVRLGGAASVACLLRHLDARVTLAGVIGDDASGRTVRRLLDEIGIRDDLVLSDPDRCTTTKERFVGRAAGRHPHQILRVDHETPHPIEAAIEHQLRCEVVKRLEEFQAVLVSDYAKGVCTPQLLATIIGEARRRGIPVLVDPARITDWQRYRGASLLTPNRAEAAGALGRAIHSPADALAAGCELRQRWELPGVLVTLDREGIVVVADRQEIVATRPRQVYDVTGAGDMVLAVAGLCGAIDLPLRQTAILANTAAGLEVERFGVAPVTREEIRAELSFEKGTGSDQDDRCLSPLRARCNKLVTLHEMADLAAGYRRQGHRIVFTNGCFDLLHVGHVSYLEEAARLGDVLVVAVNGDMGARRLKGPGRPVIKEGERVAMLAALACVDHVLTFDQGTPCDLIVRIRPDVLVKGGDYAVEEVVGHEIVELYGGEVRVTGEVTGASTTKILASVRGR